MKLKQRISFRLCSLALLLAFSLLLSTGAFAEDASAEPVFTTHTTALFTDLQGGYDQLTIETYLTGDPVQEEHVVKPCDIIFVLDQSRAMNGTQGDTRREIIKAMGALLDGLAEPTESGAEHRIAIAGYGRVNVNEYLDAYSEADYPGQQHKGSGISLNTGYYTASGFVSSNGWSEVKDSTSADLPGMPSSYQNSISYESAFMTLAQAKTVLDPTTMLAWYSGASRMDAGLTLAEQLADVAKAKALADSEDRNLIVCVVASSLPIQNYNSHNVIRDTAVQAAAEKLHEQGATIFALGDYKNSGRDLAEDTEAHFQKVMTGICGRKDTLEAKKEEYFFSLSKSGSVTEALNEMITQITITVAERIMQDATVSVSAADVSSGNPAPTAPHYSAWLENIPTDTEVHIAYYDFREYAGGIPQFETKPYAELTVTLSSLLENGVIQYKTKLVPIQTLSEAAGDQDPSNLADGDKIVITIVNPVTLQYQWVGEVPQDAKLPKTEHIGYNESHAPIEPETQDSHYEFLDWYTNPECTTPVDSSFTPTAQVTTLYGKWTRYALVRYYEQLSHTTSSEGPDEVQWITYRNTPTTYTPTHTDYQFAGWYLDKDCTIAYTPQAVTEDLDLYAKWTANTDPTTGRPSTYYTLTYESGGGTKYKNETYLAGTSVILSKAPIREEYQFTGWYADKELTKPIDRVLMNANTTVYAGWVVSTVPELLNGDDHYAYIVGYEDGTVRPQGDITRAEIAAIFFRLLKEDVRNEYLTSENPFTDVGENAWYCKAVSTLYALGILDGRTKTTFAPNASITRAELATICARFDTGITNRNHSFTDIDGHWAQDAIEEAAALGWVEGYEDGTFHPDSYITRAEAITMINRVLCRIPEQEEDLLPNMNTWPDNLDPNRWYYLAIQEATSSHDHQAKGEVHETWTKLREDPDWAQYEK